MKISIKRILILFVTILITLIALAYFCIKLFDYFTNSDIDVDKGISFSDVRQIKQLAQSFSYPVKSINFYNCRRLRKNIKLPTGGLVKESEKCIQGDLELITGFHMGDRGPLSGGSEYRHYYLLRKINNKWTIIEDLGEISGIS